MAELHDQLVEVLRDHRGQIMTRQQIIELVQAKFPDKSEDSIQIKDHAKPYYPKASVCSICRNDESRRLLDWVRRGRYKVR